MRPGGCEARWARSWCSPSPRPRGWSSTPCSFGGLPPMKARRRSGAQLRPGDRPEEERLPHVRHELALLYVAVTRTRSTLLAWDGEKPAPGLGGAGDRPAGLQDTRDWTGWPSCGRPPPPPRSGRRRATTSSSGSATPRRGNAIATPARRPKRSLLPRTCSKPTATTLRPRRFTRVWAKSPWPPAAGSAAGDWERAEEGMALGRRGAPGADLFRAPRRDRAAGWRRPRLPGRRWATTRGRSRCGGARGHSTGSPGRRSRPANTRKAADLFERARMSRDAAGAWETGEGVRARRETCGCASGTTRRPPACSAARQRGEAAALPAAARQSPGGRAAAGEAWGDREGGRCICGGGRGIGGGPAPASNPRCRQPKPSARRSRQPSGWRRWAGTPRRRRCSCRAGAVDAAARRYERAGGPIWVWRDATRWPGGGWKPRESWTWRPARPR